MTKRERANQLLRQAPGFPPVPERFLASDSAFEEWLNSRWTRQWKKFRDQIEYELGRESIDRYLEKQKSIRY